jgi:hypothetical protein
MGLLEPDERYRGGHGPSRLSAASGTRGCARQAAAGPPAFVVHELAAAAAVLRAAAERDCEVFLLSPHAASGYWGPAYFQALLKLASEQAPQARFRAALDCAGEPGDVLAALREGVKLVVFTGAAVTRKRLSEIAAAGGQEVLRRRPAALDLLRHPDPYEAAVAAIEVQLHRAAPRDKPRRRSTRAKQGV